MSTSESFSWGADTVSRGDAGHQRSYKASGRTSLLGARMAAVIIDGLVLVVPVLAVTWLLSLAFPHHGLFFSRSGYSVAASGATKNDYSLGLPGFLVVSALSLSYFFLYEAARGQTIGKRAMGLWVRAASGGRASLNSISARTVLRLIDVLPFFYLLGMLVAILSGSRRRRIGDWAGATVVVRDGGLAHEPPRRASWRVAGYPALWLFGVLFAIFALGLGKTAGEREAIAEHPSCVAAGISTPEGREGICVRVYGLGATVYNVVDRRHALAMPEYEAHLLGSQITPTRVPNAAENQDLYPEGHGQLVSFKVAITNTGDTALRFGAPASGAPAPSYPTRSLIELALPSPGSTSTIGYPAIVSGRGAPTPSIFRAQPIMPHERLVGWVTFVAPAWSRVVLEARPADVDFFRTSPTGYVGQIRLWK